MVVYRRFPWNIQYISLKCLDGHARDLYEHLDAQFPDENQLGIGTNIPLVFSLI